MANSATPLILLMLISLLAAIEGAQNSTELKWAKKLKTRKKTTSSETVTNLQFYFHDTVSGKTPSAVRVAQATDTEKSPTLFGALLMADDPLTETPDPNSKLVGRAQGLYGSSCQQELGLIMAMNFGFTDGMYNGSSISILGKNSAMNPVREMPVVAGTGVFRLGRGYAIAKTHWIDFTTGDAIVGYNVTVIH
ncbi:PREDICTED: dirigent protein 23 [Prunus mume]|uniref:Dirigent protein n=1 Tax=Prunus mume TaxID=102107 RepID=A0ABM0PWL7_PRUMU|nr:PREDICTED: dirigent protein 23 [Prunus mume]